MHLVFGDSAASACAGSMVSVAGSTSTSTGTARACTMAAMVGAQVLPAVTTSSPGPTPRASNASHRASVPLATATAWATSQYLANSRSSSAAESPKINRPRAKTRPTSASSRGRMLSIRRRRSRKGTASGGVVLTELAVEVERPLEPVGQRHAGFPAEDAHRPAEVRIVVADVDGAAVFGERHDAAASRAVQLDEQLGQLFQADGRLGAQVEDLPDGLVRHGRREQRLDGVVDVVEVPQLGAVTEDLDLVAAQEVSDPHAQEGLPRVLDPHARAVRIGQPERHRAHSVDIAVEDVVPLAGHLVDAVDVGGPEQVPLVHREILGPAIDLSGARVDDANRGVVATAGLQDEQLRAAVDLQVGVGIGHGIDMAC